MGSVINANQVPIKGAVNFACFIWCSELALLLVEILRNTINS